MQIRTSGRVSVRREVVQRRTWILPIHSKRQSSNSNIQASWGQGKCKFSGTLTFWRKSEINVEKDYFAVELLIFDFLPRRQLVGSVLIFKRPFRRIFGRLSEKSAEFLEDELWILPLPQFATKFQEKVKSLFKVWTILFLSTSDRFQNYRLLKMKKRRGEG